jgi:hypothetical protein
VAWIVGIYLLAAASVAGDPGAEPQQLTPEAGSKLLVTDVQRPPHKLTLPAELAKPGWGFWGLYKICVDPQGKVAAVKILRTATTHGSITPVPPLNNLNQHWIEIVKGWQYRPHQVGGQARPFCYVAKLDLEQPFKDKQGNLQLLSSEAGSLLRLNRAGMVTWGLYKLCLGTKGEVTKVTTIKPADDDGLDLAWAQVMRTWQHKPYLVDGVATPACYVTRLEVRAESDD